MQITWDKPSELEEYISKLQAAAERLTTENRRLRHCHAILVDKVPSTSHSLKCHVIDNMESYDSVQSDYIYAFQLTFIFCLEITYLESKFLP